MQITEENRPRATPAATAPTVRFHDVVNLLTGEQVAAVTELRKPFEDRAVFGPIGGTGLADNPAKWMSEQIGDIAAHAQRQGIRARPILIDAPLSALAHSNTSVACDAAARRSTLCHQELCFSFSDAAFAGDELDYVKRLSNMRRNGFRIAIDMRKSSQTPLDGPLRLLVDVVRIDARALQTDASLEVIASVAQACGIMVVADNARWRDGELLASFGIDAAVNPTADA